MNSEDIRKLEDLYVADTYARYDVVIARGAGVRCYDPEGKEYLDFTSGIGVNALGFCEPGWVRAVTEQAGKLQHTSNLFYTSPCSLAAEKMIRLSGMSNMFFCNSGAEANEGAIKTARKYSQLKYGTGDGGEPFDRYEIITLDGSFHGRTMATITATGQESFHKDFSPFLQGFAYAKANDADDLRAKLSDRTCAVMIEFVQGEGGVNDLDPAYVRTIADICATKDILLIADEVQTGVARTGEFMAYDHFDVKPDIVTAAKGMGGGLPIGAILFGERTKDVLKHGDHGSTYGGNPVVCAGADYVLSKIDGAFLSNVRKNGAYIKERLLAMDGVSDVSGKGLMIGAALADKKAGDVVRACIKNGLLILTAKDKLRLLPPLIIRRDEIDAGLDILERALKG
ncbi:MAG: aspartate aminotransferase family protein [Clostridiales Family XIII bacterium]|nr:aspartate aminotransferase family protein [Clostridiales Family XIII bacterium]